MTNGSPNCVHGLFLSKTARRIVRKYSDDFPSKSINLKSKKMITVKTSTQNANIGKRWSDNEKIRLSFMVKNKTEISLMENVLKRTKSAIESKIKEIKNEKIILPHQPEENLIYLSDKKWRPSPGYKWVNSKDPHNLKVVEENTLLESVNNPNIPIDSIEGEYEKIENPYFIKVGKKKWKPSIGFQWINPDDIKSLSVKLPNELLFYIKNEKQIIHGQYVTYIRDNKLFYLNEDCIQVYDLKNNASFFDPKINEAFKNFEGTPSVEVSPSGSFVFLQEREELTGRLTGKTILYNSKLKSNTELSLEEHNDELNFGYFSPDESKLGYVSGIGKTLNLKVIEIDSLKESEEIIANWKENDYSFYNTGQNGIPIFWGFDLDPEYEYNVIYNEYCEIIQEYEIKYVSNSQKILITSGGVVFNNGNMAFTLVHFDMVKDIVISEDDLLLAYIISKPESEFLDKILIVDIESGKYILELSIPKTGIWDGWSNGNEKSPLFKSVKLIGFSKINNYSLLINKHDSVSLLPLVFK